jgi:cell division transport system permease protein
VLGGRFDLPLARTAPGRVLPWLAGALVYAAVVLLAVLITADRALLALDERAQLATVTLPQSSEAAVAAALEVLQRDRAVLAAAPLSDAELRALLMPWLGEADGANLPWPAMIDIRLDPLAEPDLAALEARLREVVPGAMLVIDPGTPDRAAQIAALARGWSGMLLVVALAAALLAVAVLTRLSLRLCGEAVELLHQMGASPAYQAAQLERYALASGLLGGAGGLGLALVTVAALLYSIRPLALAAAIELGLRPLDWGLLVGLAATSVLLAVAVVRATAYQQLQRPW